MGGKYFEMTFQDILSLCFYRNELEDRGEICIQFFNLGYMFSELFPEIN